MRADLAPLSQALYQRVQELFAAHPEWNGMVCGGWRGIYHTSFGSPQIRREWDDKLTGELGNQLRAVVGAAQYLDYANREVQDISLVTVRTPAGIQAWVYESHVGSPSSEHTVNWSLGEEDDYTVGMPVVTRWPLTAEGLDLGEEQEWQSVTPTEWTVTFELPPVAEPHRRLAEFGLNDALTAPELSEQRVRQLGRSEHALPLVPRRRRTP